MENNAEPVRFKLFNCAFGVHSSLLIGSSDAIYDMMDIVFATDRFVKSRVLVEERGVRFCVPSILTTMLRKRKTDI